MTFTHEPFLRFDLVRETQTTVCGSAAGNKKPREKRGEKYFYVDTGLHSQLIAYNCFNNAQQNNTQIQPHTPVFHIPDVMFNSFYQ